MNYWTDKSVAVTGGAGFVGSHLVPLLVEAGARVVVVDNGSNGHHRVDGAQYRVRDAGDPQGMETLYSRFRTEIVINLAAHVAGVIYNQQNQLEMYERNIRLQTAPLVAAEKSDAQRFLQVSSVCVYAPEHNHPATEAHGHDGEPVSANNGYSWAKRQGERAVGWSKIPHASIVRPSNLYGPGDHFDERAHVIPALIKKVFQQDTIEVHGTGNEIREFLYVGDMARGLMAAVAHGKHQVVYNLGSQAEGSVTSIANLLATIQKVAGMSKPVRFLGGNAGDPARWSDSSRAAKELGWEAQTGLEEGLRKTIEWYRSTHR